MPREVKFLQHRKQLSAIASVVLLALAGKAHALDIDYQIGLSTLQSNNIGLANTDTRDDTVLSPKLRFDATQAGSILNLKARGEYQYLDYLDNTFDNESRSEFAGQLERLEEHTSELQSLMRISYAGFCLKKKKPL